MKPPHDNVVFGEFIDQKIAEWTRKTDKKVHPIKGKTLGLFLTKHVRLYLERECDQR